MSNHAVNIAAAAVAAGVVDTSEKVPALPIAIGSHGDAKASGPRPDMAAWGPAASMPASKFLGMTGKIESSDNAVDDQENLTPEEEDASQKARVRRASDGQPLAKEGRKFNRPEIHCQHCGKGYKHSSCLTKHLFVPLSSPSPINDMISSTAGRPAPWTHPPLLKMARQTVC